jgi:hypothetical protein
MRLSVDLEGRYTGYEGQLISKANCQAVNSSKKLTNEFVFISIRRVFVRFLEEIEDSKKAFRNYLTFTIEPLILLKPFFTNLSFMDSFIDWITSSRYRNKNHTPDKDWVNKIVHVDKQFSSILKVAKYQKLTSNLLAQLARIGWKFRHEKTRWLWNSSSFPLPSALMTKFRPEKLSVIFNFLFVIFSTFLVRILSVEQTVVENLKTPERIPKPSGFSGLIGILIRFQGEFRSQK